MQSERMTLFLATLLLAACTGLAGGQPPFKGQLPRAMHVPMERLPQITVGKDEGDLLGGDNRVLQAAVDYLAGLGGGVLLIRKGTYIMHDSLHVRPHVDVRGQGPATILSKAPSSLSLLAADGDFGEEQITLQDPEGFQIGYGLTVWDDRAGGFHTTCARITGRRGSTFSIDKPLMADCLVSRNAKAATVFPVVSLVGAENAVVENLCVEGNKESNAFLNGCRGAGIYLYRAHKAVIRNCIVRNFNGDGISFQQSNDVTVQACLSEGNTNLGLHPGSGSQRPVVRRSIARGNGNDGLFLCWRVQFGLFEENVLAENGRFGISIGHKDSHNVLRWNLVVGNRSSGIFFRNETAAMAPHRNLVEGNVILDNGEGGSHCAVRIRGEVRDLRFKDNVILDTNPPEKKAQRTGFLIEEKVGPLVLEGNHIVAPAPIADKRPGR